MVNHLALIVWVASNEVLSTHLKRIRSSEIPLVVFECVGLKVKELEVVGPFVPLVLVVVCAGSWNQCLTVFKSLLCCAKLELCR